MWPKIGVGCGAVGTCLVRTYMVGREHGSKGMCEHGAPWEAPAARAYALKHLPTCNPCMHALAPALRVHTQARGHAHTDTLTIT